MGWGISELSRAVAEPKSLVQGIAGGISSAVTQAVGGAVGGMVGIEPQYAELIAQQMHQQEQMQLVSLYSNIIKSKHETEMAAIRNVRVG